ncbi:hypothetical protein PGTUg99_015900 [Puccinia graminis f. sp. tritici]|uniref:PX domain-containing protein n=1 Tax=Puccinia graminis f. sp. tritici TaxID=56615 RepID=A0A5B0RYZ5_PUCGR|nr:hypothetical protein PGTUg99_015900 [Puccinia graminis f. sp. tritici]
MAVMSDRTQTFFLSNSSPSLAARKHSAPIGPYQPPTNASTHDCSYGRGSVLPMPPNYNEGSCWTLASVRCLSPNHPESRPRAISVEVNKVSLRMDGRWAEEKPYIVEKTWEEWIDFREQLLSHYPEIESILPKLSKGQGFLESIFTNSKRNQNTLASNLKELNSFLNCLVGKCPKKVLNSSIMHAFLQTEQMLLGAHQVEYTDDEPPLCRIPLSAEVPSREEGTAISSHLQTYRFPEPAQSNPPQQLRTRSSQPNLASRQTAPGPEVEKPMTNEKLSPHSRRRPTLDPMAVIAERPPPPGSIPDLQNGQVLRSGIVGRPLAAPNARLANKSWAPLRPKTGLAQPPPLAPPKRPNTTDSRLPHEPSLKPTMSNSLRAVGKPVRPAPPRRPSETQLGSPPVAEPLKLARPHLREFKSMQDIRGTAGYNKVVGRAGRNGLVDPIRNNSVPIVGASPQMVLRARSTTSPWIKHRRNPSDSSSSFGSSQISPISSTLSSPTVTPSTSNNSSSESIPNQKIRPNLPCRRSVDSLGPNSMKLRGSTSLDLVPEQETRTITPHHHVPPAPFYSIPPRLANSSTSPLRPSKPIATCPQSQKRPHTSAGNANGLKPNSLTLKVIHLESKTNIILAIQKGLFSLPQIRSKIQNKLRLAAEIELDPQWKLRLVIIDQEEFVRPQKIIGGKSSSNDDLVDDGLLLLELINGNFKNSEIKKISIRIC